jgi:hypothetical protein
MAVTSGRGQAACQKPGAACAAAAEEEFAVVAIDQILDGSLLSKQRLLQAREHYTPSDATLSPEQAFSRWTERVSVQAELGSAREIAGLSEEELAAMEAQFVRCPVRPRSARVRQAIPAGVALAAVGAAGLLVQGLVHGLASGAQPALQLVSAACLLIGLVALAVGYLSAFGTLHLELCHGTTGLYFGKLDEHHPWLFKTMSLMHHPAAEEYRQRVLRERGWLRGVDWVMMKETVRVHDALAQTLPARSVAEKIQLLPAAPKSTRSQKPRLVRVTAPSPADQKPRDQEAPSALKQVRAAHG